MQLAKVLFCYYQHLAATLQSYQVHSMAHGPSPAGGYDSEVSFGGYGHRNNRMCPGPARLAIRLGRASAALGRAGQGGVALPPSF
jgi:hypothetical protein